MATLADSILDGFAAFILFDSHSSLLEFTRTFQYTHPLRVALTCIHIGDMLEELSYINFQEYRRHDGKNRCEHLIAMFSEEVMALACGLFVRM